jgi:hypothetical protein
MKEIAPPSPPQMNPFAKAQREGKAEKQSELILGKSIKTIATTMHKRLKINLFLVTFAPLCGYRNS